MQSVRLFLHEFDANFRIFVGIVPLTFVFFFRCEILSETSSGKTFLNSKHFSDGFLYFSLIFITDEYFLIAFKMGSVSVSSTLVEYHLVIASSEFIFEKYALKVRARQRSSEIISVFSTKRILSHLFVLLIMRLQSFHSDVFVLSVSILSLLYLRILNLLYLRILSLFYLRMPNIEYT